MLRITSCGWHVPLRRTNCGVVYTACGAVPMPRERGAGDFDEDGTSMPMESAIDCVNAIEPEKADGVFVTTRVTTALHMRCDRRSINMVSTLREAATPVAAGVHG